MKGLQMIDAYAFPAKTGALFQEYTDMLIAGDPAIREYLSIQNYEQELEHLEWKYGRPAGRLYLAYWDGVAAGCVGLRRLNETQCELKRLFVRPAFRGKQLGKQMVERILQDAKEIGYAEILLDTMPFLQSAIRLYRELGFAEIPCYNDSPLDTTIYMKLDLNEVKA